MILKAKYWQGFLLLLGLLLSLTYYFLIPEIKVVYQQKAELREQVIGLLTDERQENYRRLKEVKDEKANYLKGLENELYLESEIEGGLLRKFQQIASYTDTRLIRYSLGTVNREGFYPSQSIQLSIEGGYLEIVNFFTLLRDIPPCIKLNFTLSPAGEFLQCFFELEVLMRT